MCDRLYLVIFLVALGWTFILYFALRTKFAFLLFDPRLRTQRLFNPFFTTKGSDAPAGGRDDQEQFREGHGPPREGRSQLRQAAGERVATNLILNSKLTGRCN